MMNYKKIVKELSELGERQFDKIEMARNIIEIELIENNIDFKNFEFKTFLPKIISSTFLVDGREVEHKPTSFTGGKINSNKIILSSLTSSQDFLYKGNINFNPVCNLISKANFYFAPSVAINRKNVLKVSEGDEIDIDIKVDKFEMNLKSILVGNLNNPKKIIFSHFDSIQRGVIDNISGTVLSLDLITSNKDLLDDCLFVFDANEELSYDEPIYWGHGYREFEKKHLHLLEQAEKILIVDCVGHSEPIVYTDIGLMKLAFPIDNVENFKDKISIVSGDFDELMKVYHSDCDSSNMINEEYYGQTKELVLNFLI